ncbi:hypothetical protein niasHT_007277 [Heterodera trifolii]|uniref:Uncharacterized protein n=1 Tax=Heterodera trifolii TaxID=157864 RepID=A0ABD2LM46_9BILA
MPSTNANNGITSADDATRLRMVDPVDRYSALIVRGLIIGTGALGLGLFIRNSKLFAVFNHVKQIPQDYYQKGIIMKGIVRDLESNGIIKVEHRPAIRLPRLFGTKKPKVGGNLNLRLAGIELSPVGIEYLQKEMQLKGRLVKFSVIKLAQTEPDIVEADVTAKKVCRKQKEFFKIFLKLAYPLIFLPFHAIRHINLNTELIRKGFARTPTLDNHLHRESLQFNTNYSRLITRLLTCEKVAERRGLGLWERATWVERVQSYPSTAVQIFKHSVPAKLAVFSFELLRDLSIVLYSIAQNIYFICVELFKYCAFGYRKLSIGISKAFLVYTNAKRHLIQIGSKIGARQSPAGREIAATEEEQRK